MKAKKLFAALLAITFVVGCTKARKAKFADEDAAGATYAVAELQNVKVQATTQAAEEVSTQALETNRVKIAKTDASARLNALLVGLEITGKPATKYDLLVTVNSDFVTIFKTVASETDLNMSERQTAYRNKGLFHAPVAQIKVQAYGVIEREKNTNGERTSTLTLKTVPFAQASHVRLDSNTDNVMAVDKEYSNLLRVYDLKNKEFLFRRTFSKASNTFGAAPGHNGNLEVVRFDLKKDRLSIRKVFHSKGERNAPEANKEELMSVEAQYFKRDGTTGNMPTKLIPTTVEQAEYVQVNWNSERSSYHSPTSWFSSNCIQGQTVVIENIDNRMEEGVLSLTKSTSAMMGPQCATEFAGGDYDLDDHEQRNFELEERLSFRIFDKTKLANPVADLPYSAQVALGFGLFTGYRSEPDQFGNSGFVENEKALPVLFDFANGKVVRYVLGGLPEAGQDDKIRNLLITSAKEVVADWNNTLKYAFQGSDLQRSGPYVELLVDGVDIKKGELGDLDRNYIWNFMDAYESSTLGLAQPAQNPITGRIEAANVLMYPGNILTGVGMLKRLAEVQENYEKFKQDAAKQQLAAQAEMAKAQAAAEAENKADGAAELRKIVQLKNVNVRQSLKSVQAVSSSSLRTMIRPTTTIAKAKLANAVSKATSDLFLSRILDKAIQQKALSNPMALESVVAAEVLTAAKAGELGELSAQDIKAIGFEAKQKALMLAFTKQVESQGGCLYQTKMDAADPSAIKKDLHAALKNTYKWALAHELGHVFGLTHNFKASFDKSNFKFQGEDKTNRLYSSVMDYFDTSIVPYAGVGPYDAHAVRAAYTGRIELTNGQLVPLEKLKEILKLDSWWKLNAGQLAGAPFKQYMYCNDFDAEQDPACTRHDLGTSYTELVTRKINDYKGMYAWTNNRGDRVSYGNPSGYIARVIDTMIDIRKMNDETVYKVMFDRSQLGDMICAQRKAKNFFLEVVGTPTTNLPFNSPARFQLHEVESVKFDATGCNPVADGKGDVVREKKTMVVEAKALEDMRVPGMERLQTRGIQLDKAFATLMLTRRGLGIPRYASQNIEMSFADFDSIFFQGKDVDNNLVLNVLTQSLADRPMGIYADGIQLGQLPPQFEVSSNALTRGYTLLSTAVYLESDRSQGPMNLATHFRVGSTRTAGNRLVVGLSDLKLDDADQVKFYALSNASGAKQLVETAAARRLLIDNAESFNELIKEGLKADDKEKAAATIAKLEAKITELNKDGLLVSAEMKENGLTEKEVAGFTMSKIAETLQIIEQVAPQIKDAPTASSILQQARLFGLQNAAIMKTMLPTLGLANAAVQAALFPEPENVDQSDKDAMAKEEQRQVRVALLSALLPGNVIEQQHDLIVENLTQLNDFFNMLHPELNKAN